MKGYQEYFARSQHPSYPQQYLDYSLLKVKLKEFYNRRRQLAKIIKDNNGNLSTAQFKELTGGLDVSGSSTSGYFCYGEEVELVDVEDAVLRLSIMERKGKVNHIDLIHVWLLSMRWHRKF